ncbi:MAG: response regulator [Verrucomicrobiota bacterium]|nr:response regulator [Verrucomicrobiota bacterium]
MVPRRNVRLLCADDNPDISRMLTLVLEGSGYDVDVAGNGRAALNNISRDLSRYGAVITDMRMPGMDGFELISQSRAAGFQGPFIVLAAALSPDDRQMLREMRVSRILDKPSRPATILDAVQETLAGF